MCIFICRVYFALCVLVVQNRAVSQQLFDGNNVPSHVRKVGIETLDLPLLRYVSLKFQNINKHFRDHSRLDASNSLYNA